MPSSERGFTLIEFLVSLVVIGFIVSLLVSIFSNPLKNAVITSSCSKIMDDIRLITDAVHTYQSKHDGASPDHLDGSDITGLPLTAWPQPPARGFGGNADMKPMYYYNFSDQGMDLCGSQEALDSVIQIYGVSRDVCSEYNRNNSRDHRDGSVPTVEEPGTGSYCYDGGVFDVGVEVYVINQAVDCR